VGRRVTGRRLRDLTTNKKHENIFCPITPISKKKIPLSTVGKYGIKTKMSVDH
jgi:hypothetical protein